jgi:hypothetical protein
VIVSDLFAVTAVVVIVNVAVLAPAGTVTVAGTVADGSLDVSLTATEPPVATVPFRVTVPVDDVPPGTDVGLTVTALMNGVSTVSDTLNVVPFKVAETVTVWVVATGTVIALNVAVVDPATTVTLAGTVQLALLEAKVTTTPPAGAGVLSVIVSTELPPPTTDAVLEVSVNDADAVIVRTAD